MKHSPVNLADALSALWTLYRNIRIVRVSRLAYVICMATNAILFEDLMKSAATQTALTTASATEDYRWHAVSARDSALDGAFVFGVSSTGIFCRPSCPSKRPR